MNFIRYSDLVLITSLLRVVMIFGKDTWDNQSSPSKETSQLWYLIHFFKHWFNWKSCLVIKKAKFKLIVDWPTSINGIFKQILIAFSLLGLIRAILFRFRKVLKLYCIILAALSHSSSTSFSILKPLSFCEGASSARDEGIYRRRDARTPSGSLSQYKCCASHGRDGYSAARTVLLLFPKHAVKAPRPFVLIWFAFKAISQVRPSWNLCLYFFRQN